MHRSSHGTRLQYCTDRRCFRLRSAVFVDHPHKSLYLLLQLNCILFHGGYTAEELVDLAFMSFLKLFYVKRQFVVLLVPCFEALAKLIRGGVVEIKSFVAISRRP